MRFEITHDEIGFGDVGEVLSLAEAQRRARQFGRLVQMGSRSGCSLVTPDGRSAGLKAR